MPKTVKISVEMEGLEPATITGSIADPKSLAGLVQQHLAYQLAQEARDTAKPPPVSISYILAAAKSEPGRRHSQTLETLFQQAAAGAEQAYREHATGLGAVAGPTAALEKALAAHRARGLCAGLQVHGHNTVTVWLGNIEQALSPPQRHLGDPPPKPVVFFTCTGPGALLHAAQWLNDKLHGAGRG